MIGSLIGAGVSAIGNIFGGVKASQAMKKVKSNLEQRKRDNQAWYDRRYNEDATQRADAQRILTKTQDAIRDRNRQAAGMQAVSGGTEESVAAAKAANNAALAEAASRIAVAGDARKDRVEEQYLQRQGQLDDSLNQMEVNRANSIASATKTLGETAGTLGTAIDEWRDKRAGLAPAGE
jgi:hypothetical protein